MNTSPSRTPPRSPLTLSPKLKKTAGRRVSEPPNFHYPPNHQINKQNPNALNLANSLNSMSLLNSLPSPPGARKAKYDLFQLFSMLNMYGIVNDYACCLFDCYLPMIKSELIRPLRLISNNHNSKKGKIKECKKVELDVGILI